jgi:electron transfer flavoprotein alpha subunit
MASGIFIYGEQFNGQIEPYTGELVTAAKTLEIKEKITVFSAAKPEIENQLQWEDVFALIVDTSLGGSFKEDALAKCLAEMLKEKNPKYILVPATETAKSLFARIAVLLNVGMTADCTEIQIENAEFIQKKPAFGNAMVITKETDVPAIVTLVTGIYPKCPAGAGAGTTIVEGKEAESAITPLEIVEEEIDSIVDAEVILSLGRGILEKQSLKRAKCLAENMNGAIGGTRPLVDNGSLPFENQIGQTGCVVHPKVCLFLGVSGAIQHTEGVRDAKLTIAVNNDPKAGIFTFADYGVLGDAEPVIEALLKKYAKLS